MNNMTIKIIEQFDSTGKFSVEVIELDAQQANSWVEFVTDPQRFLPSIFDGLWAKTSSHPVAGQLKVIRVIKGNDGISRAIARQDNKIFATPWI